MSINQQVLKIGLLQSNASRLQNQHSSLERLINDITLHQRLKSHMRIFQNVQESINLLTSEVQNYQSNTQQQDHQKKHCSVNQKQNHQMKIVDQTKTKYYQLQQLLKIKQINHAKSCKNNICHQKEYCHSIIQQMKSNTSSFFENIKTEILKINEQKFTVNFIKKYQQLSQKSKIELSEKFGLLICQMEYANRMKDQFHLKKIKQQEQFQSKGIFLDFDQISEQTYQRLIYEFNLLNKRLDILNDCLNSRNKQKGFWKNKQFEKDQRLLQKRYQKLILEQRGVLKIGELSLKKISLQPRLSIVKKQLFNLKQFLQSKIKECQEKIHTFRQSTNKLALN